MRVSTLSMVATVIIILSHVPVNHNRQGSEIRDQFTVLYSTLHSKTKIFSTRIKLKAHTDMEIKGSLKCTFKVTENR